MKGKLPLPMLAALSGLCIHPAPAQTWTPTSAPTNYWSAVASSADGTKLVAACLDRPPVYVSTNSGVDWWAPTNLVPSTNWSVACSADGATMVAAAGAAIYTSGDSGGTWAKSSAPELSWVAVASSADGRKLAALASSSWPCYCPGLYTSTDAGATWASNSAPFNISPYDSFLVSSADGTKLASTSSRQINLSTNAGATWTATSMPEWFWNSLATSADGIKLVAAGAAIHTSPDSGASWVSSSLPDQSRGIHVTSSAEGNKLLAASQYGVIYTSTNAGVTWTSNSIPAQSWAAVASSADGNKLVAAPWNGTIFISPATTVVIYQQPASLTVPVGSNVTFRVANFGSLPVSYQWLLNGVPIEHATQDMLTIANTRLIDSGGNYSVLVSNSFGAVLSSPALLTVLPSLISTLPASGVSSTGAVFNGSVTPGSSPTVVWFEWGTDTHYGYATPAVVVGTGFAATNFNWATTGLVQAAVYHYRAVASNSLGIIHGEDAGFGLSFEPISAPNALWRAVAASADGNKLAAISWHGEIYTSTNAGGSWTGRDVPPTNWVSIASSADGTKLVAVATGQNFSYAGPVYVSTNSGLRWTRASAPDTNWTSVASSADGSRIVAALGYPGGGIYTSTNSGTTWTLTSAPHLSWRSVASSADGSQFVAAPSCCYPDLKPIYISTNSGADWVAASTPALAWTSVASSADGSKLVAAATRGGIYTSTNGGLTWVPREPGGYWYGGDYTSVASSADGTQLAAANSYPDLLLYTSTDSGATWIPRGPAKYWNSIASSADGHRLVAVENGSIYRWQWTPAPQLSLTRSGSNARISWLAPSIDLVLQQNTELNPTHWTDVPATPTLNLTNLRNEVTVSAPPGSRFYRLRR